MATLQISIMMDTVSRFPGISHLQHNTADMIQVTSILKNISKTCSLMNRPICIINFTFCHRTCAVFIHFRENFSIIHIGIFNPCFCFCFHIVFRKCFTGYAFRFFLDLTFPVLTFPNHPFCLCIFCIHPFSFDSI